MNINNYNLVYDQLVLDPNTIQTHCGYNDFIKHGILLQEDGDNLMGPSGTCNFNWTLPNGGFKIFEIFGGGQRTKFVKVCLFQVKFNFSIEIIFSQ